MDEEKACRRMGQVRRSGRELGGWKKYKSGTGNGRIFSWIKPTGGRGAFSCGSLKSTLGFKSLLDMKMW